MHYSNNNRAKKEVLEELYLCLKVVVALALHRPQKATSDTAVKRP